MSEPTARIAGGCSCGAIRYVLTRSPDQAVVCHCSDCRRAAGAQSVAWLILPVAGFEVVRGAPATHRSSSPVLRTFCSTCGTSISYQHDDSPERIDVTIGSLDDPEQFVPTKTEFEHERLSWAASI